MGVGSETTFLFPTQNGPTVTSQFSTIVPSQRPITCRPSWPACQTRPPRLFSCPKEVRWGKTSIFESNLTTRHISLWIIVVAVSPTTKVFFSPGSRNTIFRQNRHLKNLFLQKFRLSFRFTPRPVNPQGSLLPLVEDCSAPCPWPCHSTPARYLPWECLLFCIFSKPNPSYLKVHIQLFSFAFHRTSNLTSSINLPCQNGRNGFTTHRVRRHPRRSFAKLLLILPLSAFRRSLQAVKL